MQHKSLQHLTHCSGTKRGTCSTATITLSLCLGLSACAAPVTRQVAMYPVTNMTERCANVTPRNASGCLEKAGDRCTIWTKSRDVSYADFGALVRACIR